ncbi:hypothetical protein [Sinorhizobium sp. Sb3]|uniref:hypothetical protein n=1 Tax=Sinorhizobium sp. Sb3 TaxID=1358417 RepID=UPI000A95C154|nr:hypothetical protein [Sinorhizobium sp. Sb3]
MRHERRRVEVFDTPSGLGGSHTVSIVKELAADRKCKCASGMGAFLEEYSTLESIVEAARTQGYEVRGLTREMMLAMIKESGPPHPPSLGERLGIVR